MDSATPKPKVYRLRELPVHVDRLAAAQLLSEALGDIASSDIRIFSLATARHAERPATKTATLMFDKTPALVGSGSKEKWIVRVTGLRDNIILDTDFMGITQLNEVSDNEHRFDLVVISGLASHPFGSWQPKSDDRTFMWIRDALARDVPGLRVFLYGYETTLKGSNSFESIPDISITFINHLKASIWTKPTKKPLLLLAHSLGGIIAKEALTTLADKDKATLRLVQGGIFFGVPSTGMQTKHLLAIIKGQPNEDLVRDLSVKSEYLRMLDDRFSGICSLRNMKIFWAYEQRTSPTVVELPNGSLSRLGPQEILVTPESATRGLCHSDLSSTFPVKENHSDMVKFVEGDHSYDIVVHKLLDLCKHDMLDIASQKLKDLPLDTADPDTTPNKSQPTRLKAWSSDDLISSLGAPELNTRLESIGGNFSNTFDWIYDDSTTGFPQWLKKGSGMFWIHGKPGSGKSTLMKFIYQNRQTWELIHDWKTDALEIKAGFFFHHRGTTLQKSFEGLLRSLLIQILKQQPKLHVILNPVLEEARLPYDRFNWGLHELERGLRLIIKQAVFPLRIILFFDALDEYDGQPEFIGQFLQDLIHVAESTSTQLQICFSSRPWDTFVNKFARCASLQLQDFTQNDIRQYCLGRLELHEHSVHPQIIDLVPEIVNRASGVFLWVTLVMTDLISEAVEGKQPSELQSTLLSLPHDLHEYYSMIVRRIPEAARWETYIILKVLSFELPDDLNLSGSTSLVFLLSALEASTCSTFEDTERKLKELIFRLAPRLSDPNMLYRTKHPTKYFIKRMKISQPFRFMVYNHQRWQGYVLWKDFDSGTIRKSISRLTEACGGLIESDRSSAPYNDKFQLLHQTVKEFIDSLEFKQTVLGSRAALVAENGYSSVAKFLLVCGNLNCEYFWLRAEKTTGISNMQFLETVPRNRFPQLDARVNGKCPLVSPRSPLGYAVLTGLQLSVQDMLLTNTDLFRQCQEPLLEFATLSIIDANPYSIHERVYIRLGMLRLLFANGYKTAQNSEAFLKLVLADKDRYFVLFLPKRGVLRKTPFYACVLESDITHKLVSCILENGQAMEMKIPSNFRKWPSKHGIPKPWYHALHLSGFKVSMSLLDHGADPNVLDSDGKTPMDILFERYFSRITHKLWPRSWESFPDLLFVSFKELYEKLCLLIERGGHTNRTRKKSWERYISENAGFDKDTETVQKYFEQIQFKS